MKVRQAALLPIFRSQNELKVLALLFVNSGRSYSIADIARETGVSEPTVSREVARFHKANLLTTRNVGRTKLVEANAASPYFEHLRALLLMAAGPTQVLKERLHRVSGVVDAYIFGSWARRYEGELGEPPRDLDILIVGNPDQGEIDDTCRKAERRLGLEVNPVVVTPREWKTASSGFLRQLKKSALVPLWEPSR